MQHTTLVFTDIEESSRLWERHPNAFLTVVKRHDELIRESLALCCGNEVKRLGDGVFLSFERTIDALQFALDIQRRITAEPWPQLGRGETLRVRIGIHYGDPHTIEDDLLGLPVNIAARLCAAGNGGQTLLSDQANSALTQESVEYGVLSIGAAAPALNSQPSTLNSQLSTLNPHPSTLNPPPVWRLDCLGLYRLRGFSRFEPVYQLSDGRSQTKFPPLRAGTISLPPERNTFVGREKVLTVLEKLITGSQTRLVTLTGIGGMGKTRTALRLAHRLVAAFEGGIYFVELAPLSHSSEVVPLLVQTVGAAGHPDDDPIRVIRDLLDDQITLIVLDNLEHLEGIERIVSDLLHACPSLRILATSRVVLQTWNQQEVELPPLEVPSTEFQVPSTQFQVPSTQFQVPSTQFQVPSTQFQVPSTEYRVPSIEGGLSTLDSQNSKLNTQHSILNTRTIRRAASVRMFVQRAQNFDRSFRLTEQNAHAVAEICRTTAGIPLAIEIAAQLIQLYDPASIAARLHGKLLEIEAKTPDLPDRLRSLYAAFEYSYHLLAPESRALLGNLLVFRGGFTFDAVEALEMVVDVESTWKGLLDHRWVERGDTPGGRRYRLLEPVAEFIREKSGVPQERAFEAHAEYYLRKAQEIDSRFRNRNISESFQRLRDDLDNFRSALRWACNTGRHEIAARMGAYLSNTLLDGGLWEEFESWVGLAMRSAEIIGHGPLMSQLATIKGLVAERRGDLAGASNCFALALVHAAHSNRDLLRAHINLARIAQETGDTTVCAQHAEQVIVIAPKCDMLSDAGLGYCYLAGIREGDGKQQEAERLWSAARIGFEEAGDEWALAHWDRERGRTKERLGDLPAARRYYGSCIRRFSELGLHQHMAFVLGRLALAAVQQADYPFCADALAIASQYSGSRYYEVKVLGDVARELRESVGENAAKQLLEAAAGASLEALLERS